MKVRCEKVDAAEEATIGVVHCREAKEGANIRTRADAMSVVGAAATRIAET